MTFADLVDLRVDALAREQMGAYYTPGAWPRWNDVLADWIVFTIVVDVIGRAVRDPFAPGNADVLLAADMLVEQTAIELVTAIKTAGEAIRRRPLVSLPAIEVLHADEEG